MADLTMTSDPRVDAPELIEARADSHQVPSSLTTDNQFPSSTLEDLLESKNGFNTDARGALADCLLQKIVFETRSAYLSFLDSGNTKDGLDAVESGLEKLSRLSSLQQEKPSSWYAARIQFLGTLERFEEGQKELRNYLGQTRSSLSPIIIGEDVDPEIYYEEMLSRSYEDLELSTWAQEPGLAVLAAQNLNLDPKIFKNHDPNSPNRHFVELKDYLNKGLALEDKANLAKPHERLSYLTGALCKYAEACELVELHRKYLEHPKALLISHDHVVCTNLFFSAARVCVQFDHQFPSNPSYKSPQNLDCQPPLQEKDWKTQALYFLERVRSRALLTSIEKYEEESLPEPQKISLKGLVRDAQTVLFDEKQKSLLDMARETTVSIEYTQIPSLADNILPKIRARRQFKQVVAEVQRLNITQTAREMHVAKPLGDMIADIPTDTIVIEYGLASHKRPGLGILVLTSQGIEYTSWKNMKINPIRTSITALQTYSVACSERETSKKDLAYMRKEITELVQTLYDHLLRPIESFFSQKKLTIVPSGDLAHIPWSILLQTSGIGYQGISVVPSFRIWHRHHCISRAGSWSSSAVPTTVVCNSWMNGDNLPLSRVESYFIARTNNTYPILADRSSRAVFEENAKNAVILHLSAHSDFNTNLPMLSAINLFPERMTVLDITRLAIKAELVVFSSCLSAYSRVFDSGAAFSFAHALLGNGSRCFIGTLWDVPDIACTIVMILFYMDLKCGSTPMVALFNAQTTLKTIDEHALYKLCDAILDIFRKDKMKEVEVYVRNPLYWINFQIRHLGIRQDSNHSREEIMPFSTNATPNNTKEELLTELRAPWCWGAFTIIGYGDNLI